ncbi:MAG: ATP synthase F0 subunit A [Acidobacteria bacterium]|nr:MAG: ATP synthase F0 subunit A [Acidobacteriota bacterium]
MNVYLTGTSDDPLSHVVQHPLLTKELHLDLLGGLLTPQGQITVLSDQIVVMLAGALLLAIFLPLFVRRRQDPTDEVGRLVPTGFGNLVEMICQYLRDEVAKPNLGPHTDRFVKYLWTAFFFILTMNLLGLIPIGSVMPLLTGLHIGGTPTANIFVTSTLAIMTFFLMVFYGLRLGGVDYLKHFNPGPPWIAPLMVPLEIIGTLAKVAALAVRLFAAMAGGHILLAVLVGLVLAAGSTLGLIKGLPVIVLIVVGSVAISLVELFVAFLQAFIFTYLSALFIGMSVNVHHDDHDEGHLEGAPAH